MPDVLQIPPSQLFALLAAVCFAVGLNVYATVAALGLLARFGHLPLPAGLQLIESWTVIVASTALFAIEFFADKIPAIDLVWNATPFRATTSGDSVRSRCRARVPSHAPLLPMAERRPFEPP